MTSTLKNKQPSFFTRTEVNHFAGEYQDGDALTVRAICEVDAYLYVFYQQADGKTFKIFPNGIQPQNRVKAKTWVAIPGDDDLFRWRVDSPFGKEVITVVATRTRVEAWAQPVKKAERFQPVQPLQIESAENELRKRPPGDWAKQSTRIVTAVRGQGFYRSAGRRFALIVGVSEYMYDSLIEKAFKDEPDGPEKPKSQALPSCANDAELVRFAFAERGRLDDVRVLKGPDATREKIEKAITEWLPAVSKPGDTVFIYHSGHGGQTEDDDGDERQTDGDGKDECPVALRLRRSQCLVRGGKDGQTDLFQSLLSLAGTGLPPKDESPPTRSGRKRP